MRDSILGYPYHAQHVKTRRRRRDCSLLTSECKAHYVVTCRRCYQLLKIQGRNHLVRMSSSREISHTTPTLIHPLLPPPSDLRAPPFMFRKKCISLHFAHASAISAYAAFITVLINIHRRHCQHQSYTVNTSHHSSAHPIYLLDSDPNNSRPLHPPQFQHGRARTLSGEQSSDTTTWHALVQITDGLMASTLNRISLHSHSESSARRSFRLACRPFKSVPCMVSR